MLKLNQVKGLHTFRIKIKLLQRMERLKMTAVLRINEELNGIELYFDSKPEQGVLTHLKSNGFRYSGLKNAGGANGQKNQCRSLMVLLNKKSHLLKQSLKPKRKLRV